MKLKIESTITERLKLESRSVAIITLPGMGLTSLIKSICQLDFGIYIKVMPDGILHLWEKEYKQRQKNRRYVLHAAIIQAVIAQFSLESLAETDLYKTNLVKFFSDISVLQEYESVYVVIDRFQDLPPELAVMVLDETKFLDDHRDDQVYASIRSLKFIIGGTIDLGLLYRDKGMKDVSPATNFAKHKPHEFLLDETTVKALIEETNKGLKTEEVQFVVEWSSGYMHYINTLSDWVRDQKREIGDDCSLQQLLIRMKSTIEEDEAKNIFSYCYSGWKNKKNDEEAVTILGKVVSAGTVYTLSPKVKELVCGGLLIEKRAQPNSYRFPNQLVELYIRQKLAEKAKALPIVESASWVIRDQNKKAYSQLLEIENRLRNFIGDTLLEKGKSKTIEEIVESIAERLNNLDPQSKRGADWRDGLYQRRTVEERSPYSSGETFDSILMYLDFPDLAEIISVTREYFDTTLVDNLPAFLNELNYIRRRIAHNRPITDMHLSDLSSRWIKIQRMMGK